MKPKISHFPKFLIVLFCSFCLLPEVFAQQGKIRGTVLDQSSQEPLPFASIGVYTDRDSLIGGGISDEKGKFSVDLPFGKFYAVVEFMGYEANKSDFFTLS